MPQLHLLDVEPLRTLRTDLVLHIDTLEREIPKKHPKEQHPDRPHVHLVVVHLLLEDLRSHVRSRPAESIHIFVVLSTKPQITYLDDIPIRVSFCQVRQQQDVLSLDIPVNQILGMNRRQPQQNTLDYMRALLKIHDSMLLRPLERVDVAPIAKLHDDEDPPLV